MINKSSYSSLTTIFFLCLLTALCKSTPFSPIQAGTFYITSADLKGLSQKTIKQVQLQTAWEIFDQNLNINVACVISSINMDQRVGMEFTYKLADKPTSDGSGKRKILLVEIVDKKGFQYKDLKLGVNYLIAQNLRSANYNMTDYQQHLMDQSLNEQEANPSNKEVHNQLFLFPNGFSSFNITHHIMYNYIQPPYDMYTMHYMTGKGEHMEQGWLQGRDFINFRWILFPKYQFGYKSCGAVYETFLKDNFYFNCDKKGTDGYFFGLMGYGGANFIGEFSMSRTGFSFHVQKIDQGKMYNVLAIPYKINDKFQFIDNRQHDYDYIEEKSFFGYLAVAVGLLIIIAVVFVVMRNQKKVYFDLQQENVTEASSTTKQRKYQKNPKSKNSPNSQEKNSDEEMKEKAIQQSQTFPSDQIENKKDKFTIE